MIEGFAPLFIYGGVSMGLTSFNRRREEAEKKAKEAKKAADKKAKKEK